MDENMIYYLLLQFVFDLCYFYVAAGRYEVVVVIIVLNIM